jgi:hypothetical protein
MSQLLHEIIRAVDEEIKDKLPTLKTEKDRIEMRKNLRALERMIAHIRKELLKESKTLKLNRKQKRQAKLNNINLKNNNNNNIVQDAGSLQEEKETSEE